MKITEIYQEFALVLDGFVGSLLLNNVLEGLPILAVAWLVPTILIWAIEKEMTTPGTKSVISGLKRARLAFVLVSLVLVFWIVVTSY